MNCVNQLQNKEELIRRVRNFELDKTSIKFLWNALESLKINPPV